MKRQCPCCGYYTIDNDDDVIVDTCEVCGWQYDLPAHKKPDTMIGANHITLSEARQNYNKYGVSKKRLIGSDQVRKPYIDELPENNQ